MRRSSAGGKRDKDLFRQRGRYVQRHSGTHVRMDLTVRQAWVSLPSLLTV